MSIIWYSACVYYMLIPSPAALIVSMIIPEGPAALPDFTLVIALDAISG